MKNWNNNKIIWDNLADGIVYSINPGVGTMGYVQIGAPNPTVGLYVQHDLDYIYSIDNFRNWQGIEVQKSSQKTVQIQLSATVYSRN